jgi:hypothetical protein
MPRYKTSERVNAVEEHQITFIRDGLRGEDYRTTQNSRHRRADIISRAVGEAVGHVLSSTLLFARLFRSQDFVMRTQDPKAFISLGFLWRNVLIRRLIQMSLPCGLAGKEAHSIKYSRSSISSLYALRPNRLGGLRSRWNSLERRFLRYPQGDFRCRITFGRLSSSIPAHLPLARVGTSSATAALSTE